jgi:diacylglycerol kinase family enzyme
MARRAPALVSLLLATAAIGVAVAVAISRFPRGLTVLACVALAFAAAWYAVRRQGLRRRAGAVVAALALAGGVALVIVEGHLVADLVVLAAAAGSIAAAARAFTAHVRLPTADPPAHPVLVYNPLSGDGKAERFGLAEEARRRGIETVELKRGDDLEQLAREAVHRGADALAMAGGDGSQAIVAAIASELGLPYACIPAGTRNHFALDLGVDRDDVVGALDAFVDGGERCVDLAEVNGRVFVNNVSLGLYAEAVQKPGYREAKLSTLLATVPEVIGPEADPPMLAWTSPRGRESGAAILVSNNRYRLGRGLASATRPRLDRGRLGIAVLGPSEGDDDGDRSMHLGMEQWTDRRFRIEADDPVPAGIDGEAVVLDPPLRFRTMPGVLRVRIAAGHPGASPSALIPDSPVEAFAALARIAFEGRDSSERD